MGLLIMLALGYLAAMFASIGVYVVQKNLYDSWPIVHANVTAVQCCLLPGNLSNCCWLYSDANVPPINTDYYGSWQVQFINPFNGQLTTTYVYTWDDFPEIATAGSVATWLMSQDVVNWPLQINPGYATGSIPNCNADPGANSDNTDDFGLTNNCAVEWPGVIDDSSGNFIWMVVMLALFIPVWVVPMVLFVVCCIKPSCDCDCLPYSCRHPSCDMSCDCCSGSVGVAPPPVALVSPTFTAPILDPPVVVDPTPVVFTPAPVVVEPVSASPDPGGMVLVPLAAPTSEEPHPDSSGSASKSSKEESVSRSASADDPNLPSY